jgi:cytochrome b involved in lipid metabolism
MELTMTRQEVARSVLDGKKLIIIGEKIYNVSEFLTR